MLPLILTNRSPVESNARSTGIVSPTAPRSAKVPMASPVVPLYSMMLSVSLLTTKRFPFGPKVRPSGLSGPSLPEATNVPINSPVVPLYSETLSEEVSGSEEVTGTKRFPLGPKAKVNRATVPGPVKNVPSGAPVAPSYLITLFVMTLTTNRSPSGPMSMPPANDRPPLSGATIAPSAVPSKRSNSVTLLPAKPVTRRFPGFPKAGTHSKLA